MKRGIATLVAMVGFCLAGLAQAEGADPTRGATLAKGKCGACHDLTDGKKNKVGPYLFGIAGQPAGKVAEFKYSDPHQKAATEKKLVWDAQTLDAYLKSPKDFIPGNRMTFNGMPNDQERADLVAFIMSLK